MRIRRLIPVMALGALVVGCHTTPTDVLTIPSSPSTNVPVGTEFSLAVGESVVINAGEARITFANVAGDSRCPTNALVSCIWAGSVRLALSIADGGDAKTTEIETVPARDVVMLSRFQLQLVGVTPERTALDSIPTAAYRARMVVRRR